MRVEAPVYSVSQVNQYIKDMMEQDTVLEALFVRGELSNYKIHSSGHHYFTLKDQMGGLRCVMFRREASQLRFSLKNGMKVIAFGRISVFPRDGQYQLYCAAITPDGIGDLHMAFEQLRERLNQEGLFASEHKKPIPAYPDTIALITSAAGAAVRDIIRILGARWPMAKVVLLPVRVQGEEAPPELAGALQYANRWKVADLIIIGRGGGSMEDLWAFNDERVARAIYQSDIPVISAVGHEPDVTISDYVADLRAATPSNAAELAVPDQNELYDQLRHLQRRAQQAVQNRLHSARAALERCAAHRKLRDPMSYIQDRRLLTDFQQKQLISAFQHIMSVKREKFARQAAALDALSPLKVLGRGYSLTQDREGHVISSICQVELGDALSLQLADGQLECTVMEKRMN